MLEQIDSLDRTATLWVNGSQNLLWDHAILVATSTWIWVPLGLVLLWLLWRDVPRRQFWLAVGLLVLGIYVADNLSASVFKPIFKRWRLTQDPVYMYAVDVVRNYRGGRYGFFSAHAANTFTVATFLALLIRHRGLSLLMMSWALLNCYTRLYLGVHYVGDILVGTICGLLVGWGCYRLFCRLAHRQSEDKGVLQAESCRIFSMSIVASYVGVVIVALLYWT